MALGAELMQAVKESGLAAKVEKVELPEIGRSVYVRTCKGSDLKSLVQATSEASTLGDTGRALALSVVMLACDENGVRIFKKEDATALTEWPLKLLRRIAEAGNRLNGLSEDVQEELSGNLSETDSDSSN